MTFGESCLPPPEIERERERERVIASSLPKPTLWSAKIVVRVIERKILGVRELHRLHAQDAHRPHS